MFDNEDWKLEVNSTKIIIQTTVSRKFIFRCDTNQYNIALTQHITNLHNNRDKINTVGENVSINDNVIKKYERPKIEKLEPIFSKNKDKIFGSKLFKLLIGK